MATGQVSPKVGKVIDIPANAPTIGTATDLALTGQVSVPFTAGSTATGGPVFSYRAISNPGSIVGTGTSSPITVSGLTDGTAYTFTVAAVNATGAGPYSAASNSATPTEPPTSFDSISTVTLSSSAATVTFSSIPSTYKHLQLRCFYSNLSGDYDQIRFNGDSGANYKVQRATAMGSSGSGQILNSQTGMIIDRYSGNGTSYPNKKDANIIDINNYASTSFYKAVKTTYGHVDAGGGYTGFNMGIWENTSAISSIVFSTAGGDFIAGSTFALYGVA